MPAKLPIPDKKEFSEQYYSLKNEEIAKIYGVSKITVIKWAKCFNLKIKNKPNKKPSKDEFAELFFNKTNQEVADFYNIGIATVGIWAKHFNIDKKHDPKPPKIEFSEIFMNSTHKETADFYNVTVSAISVWARYYGLRKTNFYDLTNILLTDIQCQVLDGSLLGDGSYRKIKGGENANSAFYESHSLKQEEYAIWKYNILKPFTSKYFYKTSVKNNKQNQEIEFYTFHNHIFTKLERKWYLRDCFGNYIYNKYGERIKIVPRDIKLSPLVLATWFYDDGYNSLNNNGKDIRLYTNGFAYEETEFLIYKLKEIGIENCWVRIDRDQPVIFIGGRRWEGDVPSYIKFINIIKDQIPCKSMNYKTDASSISSNTAKGINNNVFGQNHHNSKLTEEKVIEIRNLEKSLSHTELSQLYGIAKSSIRSVINYKTWKHVP